MNTRNEVLEEVYKTVADALSIPRGELTESTRVSEDLHADSMDIVTVAICLDDHFAVELDLADLPHANVTLGWIADYIAGRLR